MTNQFPQPRKENTMPTSITPTQKPALSSEADDLLARAYEERGAIDDQMIELEARHAEAQRIINGLEREIGQGISQDRVPRTA